MGVMRRDDFERLANIGIPLRKVFYLAFNDVPPEYSRWINISDTSNAIEEDLRMAEFGSLPAIADGDAVSFDSVIQGESRRYTPELFALGYVITKVAQEDDKYGILGVRLTRALRKSVRDRYEIEAYKILNNATSTASARFKGFDTLSLLSTAHTMLRPGVANQSNRPSAHIDLSTTAVEGAVKAFHGWKDESGFPALKVPAMAIVTGEDQYKAARVFKNAQQFDTANHEENWVKQGPDSNGVSRFLVSRRLTATKAWFLLSEKGEHDLNLLIRVDPEFSTNVDFVSGNFQAKCRTRLVSGFGYWPGVYGDPGS